MIFKLPKTLVNISCIVVIIFLAQPQGPVSAISLEYTLDDSGIQKHNQDYVPQISSAGSVQYSLTDDSFLPIILDLVDLGPVPDENGVPKGTMWNKYNLNSNVSRNTLPEVKAAGFNTLWPGFTPNKYEFKLFDQYGMKILPALEAIWPDWQARNDDFPSVTTQINSLKNEPSVLGWYLFDERDDIATYGANRIWEMSYVYKTIKKSDPNRMILMNLAADSNGTFDCDHHAYSDVFSGDAIWTLTHTTDLKYLLNSQSANKCFTSLGYTTRKPSFVGIQAFRYLDRAPVMPTAAQIRGELFSAIAGGATGLWMYYQHDPWAWCAECGEPWNLEPKDHSGISPEVYPDRWEALSQANRDITKYSRVFLSKTSTDTYHVYRKGSDSVATMLKTGLPGEVNTRYLLAVNTQATSKDMQFQFPDTVGKKTTVTSLYDPRTLSVSSDGAFGDSIEPYGVRLFKIVSDPIVVPTPTPVSSPTPSRTPTPTPVPTPTPISTPTPTPVVGRLRLVKSPISPKVYYITEKGLKRWIPNEKVFLSYGNRWQDIVTLPDYQINSYPDNILIQVPGDKKVYKIEGIIKRWIVTAEAFIKYNFQWNQIAPINQTELDFYQTGASIN